MDPTSRPRCSLWNAEYGERGGLAGAWGFYTHISNFAISYMLFAGIGYMWLMMGLSFRILLGLGAAILVTNWIYELFLPVLNVPDVIDAWYGTAGTAVGVVVLWLIHRFGMRAVAVAPPVS